MGRSQRRHLVEVLHRLAETTDIHEGHAIRAMSLDDELWIPQVVRALQKLIDDDQARLQFGTEIVEQSEQPLELERLRRGVPSGAEHQGAPTHVL
jgi:hypothetical protein